VELEPGIVTDLRDRQSYGGYLRLDRLPDAQQPVSGIACSRVAACRSRPHRSRATATSRGTGGSSGVTFLRRALERSFFPELIDVRSVIGAR
jgi:tryptophan 2,3-dioxygenase